MIVMLDIKDSKADFVMELLGSLSFVKAEPLSPYKKKVLKSVSRAVKEVNLIKAGKLKGIPAKDLVNEL
ncbi:MAG: hypothetical protein SGI96_15460 [Bacteroidota bacterium]|nr:hypothetical protein [Bacteroidota bacterium]